MLGLLAHALADLFAQVLDVVARNDNLNAVDQFGLGLRVLANDLALFGQVDFDFQVLKRYAVTEIAVQPVRLFNDGDTAGRILAKETDHRTELFAACDLGRLYVHELVCDLEFMRPGILPQEFQLRGDGVPLAFLVLAGNSGVDDGLPHDCLPLAIISPTMRSLCSCVNEYIVFRRSISC
ncbi:MAG: hypothetical protein WB716_03650 [Candidatus Acidiferrales bacterium]